MKENLSGENNEEKNKGTTNYSTGRVSGDGFASGRIYERDRKCNKAVHSIMVMMMMTMLMMMMKMMMLMKVMMILMVWIIIVRMMMTMPDRDSNNEDENSDDDDYNADDDAGSGIGGGDDDDDDDDDDGKRSKSYPMLVDLHISLNDDVYAVFTERVSFKRSQQNSK